MRVGVGVVLGSVGALDQTAGGGSDEDRAERQTTETHNRPIVSTVTKRQESTRHPEKKLQTDPIIISVASACLSLIKCVKQTTLKCPDINKWRPSSDADRESLE